MENQKVHDLMVKARAALILDSPFFGSLALRLMLQEDTKCETAWVDGVTLGYNPKFIEALNMDGLKGLICHEVMHLAVAHHCRREGRDGQQWNEAGDYAINQIVVDAGMVLPKGGLIDAKYHNMNAETIYDKRRQEKQDGGGQGKADPGQCGEVRDFPGNSPDQQATQAQKDLQAQDWQIAATQAAQQAKGCGKLPGGIEELIEKLNEPKVNWREALQRFVEQQAKNDYSFRKPNNRFTGRGVILPSLHSEELPPIIVAIDTSGSVSKEDLEQFASEIDDILTHYHTIIHAVYVDTAVNGVEVFTQDNRPVKLNAKGRGGTRFSPLFEHVNAMDEPVTCVVYLTDLDADDFGPAPDYPVLWVATAGRKHKVPFGEVIKMNM